jgi:nucleotide-binding universal stress UspA family protein
MFQTIVLAYDGSAECRDALTDGIALATRFDARCHLLAVCSTDELDGHCLWIHARRLAGQ